MFKKQKQTSSRGRQPVQPSQRSVVFSYYANRAPRGDTSRDMMRRRRDEEAAAPSDTSPSPTTGTTPWRHRFVYRGILLIIVVLSLWSLRISSEPAVIVTGGQTDQVVLRDTKIYAEAASRYFQSFWSANKLTVDTARIATQLQSDFPELRTVSVSLPLFGSTPVVYVQPIAPKLLLVTQPNGLYIVDASGRAILDAHRVEGIDALRVPVIQDQSVVDISVGKVVLPRSAVAFMTEVDYQLKAKQIEVTSYTLLPQASELQVRPKGVGYYVKFNVHGKARGATGMYLALRDKLQADRTVPKEYIDVRVENRAYYK